METNRIICGDALEELKKLPDNSVDCVITSPPYWALRDYGTATWEGGDKNCDHQVQNNIKEYEGDWERPSRTDTKYWHDYIMKADEIRFIKGRLCFDDCGKPAPFPSAIIVFRGKEC